MNVYDVTCDKTNDIRLHNLSIYIYINIKYTIQNVGCKINVQIIVDIPNANFHENFELQTPVGL